MTEMFQFLNGSIKASFHFISLLLCIKFQFLNGSIKAPPEPPPIPYIKAFQFLNGSIKAYYFFCKNTVFVVSIPQWFD